jgi:hypothetical protein
MRNAGLHANSGQVPVTFEAIYANASAPESSE